MSEPKPGKVIGNSWPSWRYGPNDQCAIFASEADVPKDWEDHPSKIKPVAKGKAAPALDL